MVRFGIKRMALRRNSKRVCTFQREAGWCEALWRGAEPVFELQAETVRRYSMSEVGCAGVSRYRERVSDIMDFDGACPQESRTFRRF